MNEPLSLVLGLAVEVIEGLGLRYAVVGGMAVSAWGAVRTTRDVDLYADLPMEARPRLKQALEAREFDVPAMDEELERFGVFRSLFKPQRVFLDIFDAGTPLGEAILERRRWVPVNDQERWTISPEDLAVLKAFSDRERDQTDLAKLIAVARPALDLDYVERWARDLDRGMGGDEVTERLRQARATAAKLSRMKR